jgi:hypothetical protein
VLAEAYYQQALALAEELGMRPLVAHCHNGLGTLYGRLGREDQARTALDAAIDLYRAMEMTFWLPQTEAALAQVETGSTPEDAVAKRSYGTEARKVSPNPIGQVVRITR